MAWDDTKSTGDIIPSSEENARTTAILARIVGASDGVPSISAGLLSARPSAGTAGRLFLATDESILYRDNGTGWDEIGISGLDWDEISGDQSDINLSGFTNDSGYITGYTVTSGDVTAHEGDINHDALANYAANQHRVWESSIAQDVHIDNIPDITLAKVSDSGALAALDTVDTLEIDDGAVTYAKIQDVSANRLLGRVGSSGVVQEITLGDNLDFDGTTLNASGGSGDIAGSIAVGQVAFGSDTDEIGGSDDFTWDNTEEQLWIKRRTDPNTPTLRLGLSQTGLSSTSGTLDAGNLRFIMSGSETHLMNSNFFYRSGVASAWFLQTNNAENVPPYSFNSDSNTGMYRVAADTLGFSTGGTKRLEIANTEITSEVPLAMGDNKITGLADPTNDQDAATKKYVDDNAGGGNPTQLTRTVLTDSGAISASAQYVALRYGEE